jgi:hypothetical protein
MYVVLADAGRGVDLEGRRMKRRINQCIMLCCENEFEPLADAVVVIFGMNDARVRLDAL